MPETPYDVIGIGNAIVDVLARRTRDHPFRHARDAATGLGGAAPARRDKLERAVHHDGP